MAPAATSLRSSTLCGQLSPGSSRTVELVSTGLSGEDVAVFSLNTRVHGFRLRFGL
jgi:hypothetical protein